MRPYFGPITIELGMEFTVCFIETCFTHIKGFAADYFIHRKSIFYVASINALMNIPGKDIHFKERSVTYFHLNFTLLYQVSAIGALDTPGLGLFAPHNA